MSTPAAVVLIAHDKPRHLARLVAALDGLPIFLHVDRNTPDELFHAMTDDLPDRVRLLPRLDAGWARFEVLAAELSGYRAAYQETDAEHIILGTGADYPLLSVDRLVDRLSLLRGVSWTSFDKLPIREWGPMRGYDRFLFRQRPEGRRRVWSPVPRRWPAGIRPAGGAQTKILARHHVGRLLEILDRRPELLRFFREAWTPDEVTLPSIFTSPAFGMDWEHSHVRGEHAWFIDWGDGDLPNPHWLDESSLPALRQTRNRPGAGALFARKFPDDSGPLLDQIEATIWN